VSLRKSLPAIVLFLAPILLVLGQPVPAESDPAAQGMLGLFGSILNAAQAQQASEAWARVPDAKRTCMARALANAGQDLSAVIQAGVMPDDPRLASINLECQQFDDANLRRNYSCTVADEAGRPIETRCDQSFARRLPDGSLLPITPSEAADLQASGAAPLFVDRETDEAARARHAEYVKEARSQQIANARQQIAQYQASPSPLVRSEAAKVLAFANRVGPSPNSTAGDQLNRAVSELDALASAEAHRLAALDQLAALKAQAEKRTGPDTPDELRTRLMTLGGKYAGVIAPPILPPAPVPPDATTLPAYPCTDSVDHVGNVVCRDPGLQALELDYNRSFYTLRQITPDQFHALNIEAITLHQKLLSACRVPTDNAPPSAAQLRVVVPCITTAYKRQKQIWTTRVNQVGPPEAIQEMARPILEHVRLQARLQAEGYLPPQEDIDGIYGSATRQAAAVRKELGL